MALRSHNSNMIGTRASTNSRRALGDVTSAYGNVNQSRVGGKAAASKGTTLGRTNACSDKCPQGTYRATTGAKSKAECTGCEAGKWSSSLGRTKACEECATAWQGAFLPLSQQ